jgi:hypothetical protein
MMKSKYFTLGILVLTIIGVVFVSGCVQQPSEKIIFTLPAELTEATGGMPYSYTFCEPDSARSGATCGELAGETTNPTGGNPPYSFSHQFDTGFIPPGLALELNGLLRGMPTLPGNYTFGICAKDTDGNEECQTTSLTVKPKSEEIIPNETNPPETFDVKITSLTCDWTVKTGDYGVKSDCVRITSKGTAQGAVGARLELPILVWSDDKFDCGNWTLRTGALIAVGSTCVRKEGQPETTTWTVDTGGDDCPLKDYFNNDRSYSVKIYLNNDIYPQKEDAKNTQCQ